MPLEDNSLSLRVLLQHQSAENMKPSEDSSVSPTEQKPKPDYVALRRQILTTVPIAAGCLAYGMVNGFPSAVVSQLKKTSSPLLTDHNVESWIASGSLLTTPLGIISNMIISRKFGRWQALLWTNVAFIITWLFAYSSYSTHMLMTSFFLLGLASGLQTITPTVYVAEISDPLYRGVLVTVAKSFNNVGILVCHYAGSVLEWQYLGLLGASFAAFTIILIQFIPETPYWLAMNDKTEKARTIYFWLRNNVPSSATEFELIVQSTTKKKNESSKWKAIFSRACLKAFLITAISVAILSVSGYFIFVYYAHDILSRMLIGVDVNTCVVIIDTIRIVSSLSAFVLIKIFSRKIMFVVSNISVIMCQIAFIVCYMYEVNGFIVMVFVCIHTICGSASLAPAVNLVVSEIFPVAVREIGNGITMILHFIMVFALIKTVPYFLINLGFVMSFGIYTCLLTVCFVSLYLLMPETENLSLPQIEQNMNNKN